MRHLHEELSYVSEYSELLTPREFRIAQVLVFLRDATWSEFAQSLVVHFERKRDLAEKQLEAAERMWRKMITKEEAKNPTAPFA